MAKILEKPIRHKFMIDGTITGIGTRIFADGIEIHGVRSIDYHLGVNEISTITMEIIPERCNLTGLSDLELTVDIDSLHTAIKCIQFEMKLNTEFRNATVASAKKRTDRTGNSGRRGIRDCDSRSKTDI